MISEFPEIPDAISNSVDIANRCSVKIELGNWHMPIFEVPNGMEASDYLRQEVEKGLLKRYGTITPEIKERVEFELSIISGKKYDMYFLVVSDFVNWAKNHNIAVGPGRGSGAGSVIAYALRITDLLFILFRAAF